MLERAPSIAAGTRIGAFEIIEVLGAGGMGEVYRARDTKLNRDVAIKLLPPDVALHPDRLARFRREAQVLASLNHPNIGGIYGFEDSDVQALVLELVEGPTLADRIAHGPIPLDETLAVGRQIADALDAAHRQGIVHRDLKPANIKLRPDGTVKVLDFGLAKAIDPAVASDADLMGSPTIASPAMTRLGVILGTAAYMSPEQARGRATDSRSDVWAFGCVLFEMLTGEQLFRGETITDVLAAIVNREPDVERLPPRVRRLLRSCLEKDPKLRLQAVGDAWLLIDEDAPTRQPTIQSSWFGWLTTLSAVLVAISATAIWMRWQQPVVERRALQFQVNPPEGAFLNEAAGGGTSISPDGRTIVIAGMSGGLRRLWIRRLDSIVPRELTGTVGADFPFWSPDGRSIGFFADGTLKKIDSSGGPPLVLAEAPQGGRGGTWGPDGTIIFGTSTGVLRRIPASGGTPVPFAKMDLVNGEYSHRWPQFLPGGRRFLFYVRSSKPNRTGIYVSSLDRPQDKVLVIPNATAGAFSAPHDNSGGYLLWARDNQLVAQRFDPERGQLSGEPIAIAETEGVGTSAIVQRASFSVSQEGTLLFTNAEDRFALAWFGRDGRLVKPVGKADRYTALRISPDGNRVAMSLIDSLNRDLWTMDLNRGLPNRVTSTGGFVPVWSPDGRRLAYHDPNQMKLFTIATDGSDPRMILESEEAVYINDWSPDGRWLLYTKIAATTHDDLWLVPVMGERKPVPLLVTPFAESHGQFSPDGKWIAFTSNDSGKQEIYVRSSDAGERTRVSTSGGSFARWRADGKELFYRSLDGRLMAVPVSPAAGRLEFGTPVALMDIVEPLGTYAYPYDIAPDGQEILTLKPATGERTAAPLTVLVNWDAALRK